jgi:NAD-dependent DNA ligase
MNVKGKTVVLTGTVPGVERKDVKAKLTALGAHVTGSVSRHTDILFAMADAGSKKIAAESLGVKTLGEKELFALIGKPAVSKPKKAPKPITKAAKAKVAARKPRASDGLHGEVVVVTGTMSKPRLAVEAELRAVGAIVHGSVSANTQYLIAGASVGAAKLAKATALGVKVIDEATMRKLLKRPS